MHYKSIFNALIIMHMASWIWSHITPS